MTEELRLKLQAMVDSHDNVLFMKGTRQQTQCGFSRTVVDILEELEIDYQTYNVFSDPEIRSGMKDFSQWPTFPQMYIKQEFIGGCDVVTDMMRSGELASILGVNLQDIPTPSISCSTEILSLFKESIATHGGGIILNISKDFNYDIAIGEKQANQTEVIVDGVSFFLSRGTAKRAHGLSLDFRDGENGGVIIDNPNEPSFEDIDVQDLPQWVKDNANAKVYQIGATEEERLPFATLLTGASQIELQNLDKSHPIAFMCRMGVRSEQAARSLAFQGYTNIVNVLGGLNAWNELNR